MAVDFSPFQAPVPQSPTSRGLRHFGDVMDAVLARRQAREQAEAQRQLQQRHYEMQSADRQAQIAATERQSEETRELRADMKQGDWDRRDQELKLRENDVKGRLLDRIAMMRREPGMEAIVASLKRQVRELQRQEDAAAATAAPAAPAPAAGPVVDQSGLDGVAATPLAAAPAPPQAAPPAPVRPRPRPRPAQAGGDDISLGYLESLPFAPDPPAALAARSPAAAPPVAPPAEPSLDDMSLSVLPEQGDLFKREYANLQADLQPFVDQGASLIRSGIPKAQAYKETIGAELDRRAAMSRAQVAGGRQGGLTPGDKLRQQLLAETTLNNVVKRTEYIEANQAFRDTEAMLAGFQSNNPAEQKAAAGLWAKQKSGPGTVQQVERDYFVNKIGGSIEDFKRRLNEVIGEGQLEGSQLKYFVDAIKDFELFRRKNRLNQVRAIVKNAFVKNPNRELRSQEYVDWAMSQIESPESLATPQSPAAGDDDVDDLLDQAGGR